MPLSKGKGELRKGHPKTFYEKGCSKNKVKQEKTEKHWP